MVILFYLLCGYNVCNGIWHIHAPTFGEVFFYDFPFVVGSLKISLCSCFIAAKFQRVLDSLMHWLLVFFRTFFLNYFIAAMFARLFDFFMSFLWCFASDQFSYFIFRICTRILDSFMPFPFVFFKMSYHSCFKTAMFVLVLDSFIHWLFAFFKTFKLLCSCNVCKGISHFHELPSSVLQGLHLYFFFICTICTRTLESFMHLFFVFFKISYHNCFKAAMFVWYMNSSCTDFWCPFESVHICNICKGIWLLH